MIASWPASQDVHGRKVEIANQYRRKGIVKADAWGIHVAIYEKLNVESPFAISGSSSGSHQPTPRKPQSVPSG